MEIKALEDFPDYYVTKDGRVYSNKSGSLKELKLSIDHDGYRTVGLYKKNGRKRIKVHRLVANAYISKESNKTCINHIDGDKSNNHFSNLEWCTPKENSIHACQHGLLKYGYPQRIGTRKNARYSDEEIDKIKELYKNGYSQRKIGQMFGCDHSVISEIVNNKIYKKIDHEK